MPKGSHEFESPRMEYRETLGQTPEGTRPVLLLHRAGGSSRDWQAQLDVVGEHRRIVAPDLPGHGRSPGPALLEIRDMAEAVASLLRRAGLRDVVAVGHSMGGAVALELSLSWPLLVSELVLIASGARLRVAQPMIEAIRDRFDLVPDLMARMLFSSRTPRAVIEAQIPVIFDAPAEVILADLEACHRFDAEPRLGELTIPVSVLTAKDDFLTPPRLGRRLAERVRDGRFQVVPGAGHLIPQEAPEVVNAAILRASEARRDLGDPAGEADAAREGGR